MGKVREKLGRFYTAGIVAYTLPLIWILKGHAHRFSGPNWWQEILGMLVYASPLAVPAIRSRVGIVLGTVLYSAVYFIDAVPRWVLQRLARGKKEGV